jgi:bla regulator protein blaR1
MLLHLWQSTLFAGVLALLALVLRNGPARVRHGIWCCAALKFLVPISPLVATGGLLGASLSVATTTGAATAVRWLDDSLPAWTVATVAGWMTPDLTASASFLPAPALFWIWVAGAVVVMGWRWTEWSAVRRLTRSAVPLDQGREAAALARIRASSPAATEVRLLLTRSRVEPAVVGIVRPVLLWPAGLTPRLTDRQLDAILAHELCHVQRRDNLIALGQMAVEILFWFHPVVWWIGARLVAERERACDEEVLHMGTSERAYAEAILEVCRLSLRAPSACIAGIRGSGLSQRIARILDRRIPARSSASLRLLLGGLLLFTLGAPLGVGALHAQRGMPHGEASERRVPQDSSATRAQDLPRPGNGVTWPRLVHEVKPAYTPEALQAGIQGVMTLEATVLEDGTVSDVVVVESLDPDFGLDEEAVNALAQWRFEPATKDGQPVAVLVPVEMSFTLK